MHDDYFDSIFASFSQTAAWFLLEHACASLAQDTTPPNDLNPECRRQDRRRAAAGAEDSRAQFKDQAWSLLTDAVTDGKKNEPQIQALGALGIMGANTRSLSLIQNAMLSPDVDVRTAAALAAGQTKSPLVTTDLRKLLDDKEPQVDYTAALTLWKMHDRSGEDILMAVVDGDRGTSPKMVDGMKQDIHRQLQNPAGIVKYGALQGAGLLLGPFGFGITAYEYLRKNGGDSARVAAVEAIAQNHTDPIRKELMAALGDKDLGVRAAAAKALSRYRDPEVATAISRSSSSTPRCRCD